MAQHDSFGLLGLVSSSSSVEDIVNSVFGDWGVLGFLCSCKVGLRKGEGERGGREGKKDGVN